MLLCHPIKTYVQVQLDQISREKKQISFAFNENDGNVHQEIPLPGKRSTLTPTTILPDYIKLRSSYPLVAELKYSCQQKQTLVNQ